jgi:hypothetical protein
MGKITTKQVLTILDGNWANDQLGTIEEIKADIDSCKSAIASMITILVNNGTISKTDIIQEFEAGWRINK